MSIEEFHTFDSTEELRNFLAERSYHTDYLEDYAHYGEEFYEKTHKEYAIVFSNSVFTKIITRLVNIEISNYGMEVLKAAGSTNSVVMGILAGFMPDYNGKSDDRAIVKDKLIKVFNNVSTNKNYSPARACDELEEAIVGIGLEFLPEYKTLFEKLFEICSPYNYDEYVVVN